MSPNRVNKVYVAWRKLIKDLKNKYPERKVTSTKIALFLYENEKSSSDTKRRRFHYRASEFHPTSEFPLTDIVNLLSYAGISFEEFIEKYTKAK